MRSPSLPRTLVSLAALVPGLVGSLDAQQTQRSARDAALALEFEELRFDPPAARRETLSSGVQVLFLEDHSLPLVSLYARFRGGFALLPRDRYAAATALPGMLRSGGTRDLPPDTVDHLLDFYALQTAFGGGGESSFSSLNTLTKHLDPALTLWKEILRYPRFDPEEVEVWRGRQSENIRRRKDSPGGFAFSEFNRLMFGDHPIGWEMEEGDLTSDRFSAQTLSEVHARIFCPENLILGIVGDVEWEVLRPRLEEMVEDWPACSAPLSEPQNPEMRREGGVFLIPRELAQSTVVMAHPAGVTQEANEAYFASRIGNSILGGSGFTSRLVSRVRTEKGWAYSASSLWTAPSRYEGIVGAVTQTKSETTIAAAQLILDTMEEMRTFPPSKEEVDRAISQIVNGFVFNFQDPSQIVSRQMYYLSQGLPEDWLEEYIQGIQRVTPRAVQRVFREHVHPEDMIILILGDPEHFDLPPETLGPVRIWEVEGVAGPSVIERLREGLRSPR
jgi:zinc protease